MEVQNMILVADYLGRSGKAVVKDLPGLVYNS